MEEKCPSCSGVGIESVDVQMPDGYGEYDMVKEDTPCRTCDGSGKS